MRSWFLQELQLFSKASDCSCWCGSDGIEATHRRTMALTKHQETVVTYLASSACFFALLIASSSATCHESLAPALRSCYSSSLADQDRSAELRSELSQPLPSGAVYTVTGTNRHHIHQTITESLGDIRLRRYTWLILYVKFHMDVGSGVLYWRFSDVSPDS